MVDLTEHIRRVHQTFGRSGLYLTAPHAMHQPVCVRIHSRSGQTRFAADDGDLAWNDAAPRAIFDVREVRPMPRELLFCGRDAYRLGVPRPEEDGFVSVELTRLTPEDAHQLREIAGIP